MFDVSCVKLLHRDHFFICLSVHTPPHPRLCIFLSVRLSVSVRPTFCVGLFLQVTRIFLLNTLVAKNTVFDQFVYG